MHPKAYPATNAVQDNSDVSSPPDRAARRVRFTRVDLTAYLLILFLGALQFFLYLRSRRCGL